jgi:hypothetical protein
MFSATLFIYKRMPGAYNGEVRNRIIRFWSGEKIGSAEIRRWLRTCGERVTFNITRIATKEIALQRFKFTARLMVAAGYAGWILFIDELELIRCYSLRQRAKSYAELARWMGKLEDWQSTGLTTVASIIDIFASEVLEGKNDLEKVPGKLRVQGSTDDLLLASQAEQGMRIIEGEGTELVSPDSSMLQAIYAKVKSIYADAYDCSPPDVTGLGILEPTTMRHHVKSWITEWDLKRKDPNYESIIETKAGELEMGYLEDKDLQVSPEGENEA